MFGSKGTRWTLFVPAMFVATVGAPLVLAGQSPEKSLIEPGTLTAPTTPTATAAAKQPNAEQAGDSLAARMRYQAAIAAYSKAPQMTATLWNKMGIAYQMMLNSKDAIRCYKESLKLEPHNAQVLNNLGTVYASMKDYPQADHLYHKAIKIDPHNAPILKNLGTDLLAEKKYDKGWALYQQAISVDPQIFSDRNGNPKVENPATIQERGAMNYYMALGCARSGHTDCALSYLRAALDEGFTDPKKIVTEAEFASLRDNPGFKRLVSEASAQ
jgi:tetratricopeptide (TPR) repeat protein